MGCGNSKKNEAPAKPEERQDDAKMRLWDQQQGGKEKEAVPLTQLIPEIQKLSVEQLTAHLDSMPVHVRTKIENAVLIATQPPASLLDTLGGPDVLKAEIDRLTVEQLAAYLEPLSAVSKERLNAAVKDAAPAGDSNNLSNLMKLDDTPPETHMNPQEDGQNGQVAGFPANRNPIANSTVVDVVPSTDVQGGAWWNCCRVAAEKEIVMGRDM